MRWKFTRSVRWRLQLWLGFLLICVLSGFGVTVWQLQRLNTFEAIDLELEQRIAMLSGSLRGDPGPGPGFGRPPPRFRLGEHISEPRGEGIPLPPLLGPEIGPPPGDAGRRGPGPRERRIREFQLSREAAALFDPALTNGFYFVIWSRDGALIRTSTNAPSLIALPPKPSVGAFTGSRMRNHFREAYHYTPQGECVLTGRNIAEDLAALRRFTGLLVAIGGVVLGLGLSGGWLIAGHAMRPIEEISSAANRISAGHLSERIAVADPPNELDRLATVLNSTFARLETAFAQQQQFTADASHELRTPLAVIISEAQTALARARSNDEYRETVQACLEVAQQMRRLTESLLDLSRFDAAREETVREPVELAEVARAGVDSLRAVARERTIEIACDFARAKVIGDAERLGQVVTNLLANALHYNHPGGRIIVSTLGEPGAAVLRVADTGMGIAPDDLPHVFKRFYRADKSRSRAEGRSGLGLAICKAIIDAHGGNIEVTSEPGQGTTFTVRLPAPDSGAG